LEAASFDLLWAKGLLGYLKELEKKHDLKIS